MSARPVLKTSIPRREWTPDHEDLFAAAKQGWKPSPLLTVSQYAEQSRYLSPVGSNAGGRWRNSKTPHLVEVMDCLSPSHPCEVVIGCFGSQMGKTESGNNFLAYCIEHQPGPFLYVKPTDDDCKNDLEQRILPMIEESAALRELVTPEKPEGGGKGRPKGVSMRRLLFPGGIMKLTGAKSARGVKSMPARWVFVDEYDEMPRNVGGQGNLLKLALARQRTFWPRKAYVNSTPTIEGASQIWEELKKTDWRRRFVPCPHCGTMQTIDWDSIKFDRDENGDLIPGSVVMVCGAGRHVDEGACGAEIEEAEKITMLGAGEWRATQRGRVGWVGFHASSLYAPLGWYSWETAAQEFIDANRDLKERRDSHAMQVWRNTVMAEPWEDDRSQKVRWPEIKARAQPYSPGKIPSGGLFLACGVDTQDDRLEALVRAWGAGEESWYVYHSVLWGDPATDVPWMQLDELLRRPWPHESGANLHIVSAAVDTQGHRTQAVYNYARTRAPQVIAIAGASQAGKPIINPPRSVDVNWQGDRIPGGAQYWPVGTDTAKAMFYSRLNLTTPGPGYYHYPIGLSDEFYKQICGEALVPKYKAGVETMNWQQLHTNVEMLDCEVYAYAAAVRAGLQHVDWEALAQMVENGKDKPEKQDKTPRRRRRVVQSRRR